MVKRMEQQPPDTLPQTITTYYLRSSALGGRVITELNRNGEKIKGNVHAGGEVLAEQQSNQVTWQHRNPLTGSRGASGAIGDYTTTVEADPLGVNVGKEDPVIDPQPSGFSPEPEMAMLAGIGGSGCSSSNPYCQKCYLDGMEMECVQVAFLSEMGAAVVAPSQTIRWNPTVNNGDRTMGAYEFFHAFNNGYSGWMTAYGYHNYEGGRSFYNSAYDDDNENKSRLTRSLDSFFSHPQSPTPLSREKVSSRIDDILQVFKDRPGCEEWINKILAEMRSSTGVTTGILGVDTSNIRNILEAFRQYGNIYSKELADGQGNGETGTKIEGFPSVSINYGTDKEKTANVLLHEIIHWAGYLGTYSFAFSPPNRVGFGYVTYKSYYNDEAMATAANKLGIVISAEEYKRRYPGLGYVNSSLAAGATRAVCQGSRSDVVTLPK